MGRALARPRGTTHMTPHRILAALSLPVLLAGSCTPARAQDTASAKAFVQQVYADYANPDRRHQEERQARFYTPGLDRLILADRTGHPGYVGKLDGDPICDCQDAGELKVQSIMFVSSGRHSLKATVAFTIVQESRTVILSLLKTPSGWRIDDIADKDMPSLRNFLHDTKRTPKAQASSVAPKA